MSCISEDELYDSSIKGPSWNVHENQLPSSRHCRVTNSVLVKYILLLIFFLDRCFINQLCFNATGETQMHCQSKKLTFRVQAFHIHWTVQWNIFSWPGSRPTQEIVPNRWAVWRRFVDIIWIYDRIIMNHAYLFYAYFFLCFCNSIVTKKV